MEVTERHKKLYELKKLKEYADKHGITGRVKGLDVAIEAEKAKKEKVKGELDKN